MLAVAAGYAYSDAPTVSTMLARLGLPNRCRLIGEYVDAMFIQSTAFVVQSLDGRLVLVAYRGTQPANLVNWLTDADIDPAKVGLRFDGDSSETFGVHAGFYRNTRATRYMVTSALLDAKEGKSITDTLSDDPGREISPMEGFYVTGHSLGGAMAAISTVLLRAEPAYRNALGDLFKATYTYGQPMVGDTALADKCESDGVLAENLIRFIYQNDPVPHLPPRDSGRFGSFGKEYSYKGSSWQEEVGAHRAVQMGYVIELIEAAIAAVGLQLPGIARLPVLRWLPSEYNFDDHAPQHYIETLTPVGKPSEFGDYSYTYTGPVSRPEDGNRLIDWHDMYLPGTSISVPIPTRIRISELLP